MAGKTDYKNQFAAEKYDRFSLMLPKGSKSKIKEVADIHTNGSINKYIANAINNQLIKDGYEPIVKKTNETKD